MCWPLHLVAFRGVSQDKRIQRAAVADKVGHSRLLVDIFDTALSIGTVDDRLFVGKQKWRCRLLLSSSSWQPVKS